MQRLIQMQRLIAVVVTTLMLFQPLAVGAQTEPLDADTRLHLADGSIVLGRLVERSDDLIIIRIKDKIFTFDQTQVDKLVTLESLGGGAEFVTVREFPYISFLGGTAAFGLLAWIQFSNASDHNAEAQRNEEQVISGDPQSAGLLRVRAQELRDDADRARLYGWGSSLLALGTLGLALYPAYTERLVFPKLSLDNQGEPTFTVAYRKTF